MRKRSEHLFSLSPWLLVGWGWDLLYEVVRSRAAVGTALYSMYVPVCTAQYKELLARI